MTIFREGAVEGETRTLSNRLKRQSQDEPKVKVGYETCVDKTPRDDHEIWYRQVRYIKCIRK